MTADTLTPAQRAISDAVVNQTMAEYFAPPTPSQRRKWAIEVITNAFHDYADELTWDDVEDFADDCCAAIRKQELTERQEASAQQCFLDAHPERPH